MMVEECEKCHTKITYKMARASEAHYGGMCLCIPHQIERTKEMVKKGEYPARLAEVRIKELEKYG